MGLVQMDNIYDYWKKESSNFGIYGNLFISSRMSRNRFMKIRRFIRFNLDEIRKETIQKFQAHWIFFSEISVDEDFDLNNTFMENLILLISKFMR
jgi:hypothetical protein